MSEQLDLSTLPQRMRYAATVLREADKRYGAGSAWFPHSLDSLADRWEDEDHEAAQREAAEREELVEELAREMFTEQGRLYPDHPNFKAPFDGASSGSQNNCRLLAAVLIDNGWRKGDPA